MRLKTKFLELGNNLHGVSVSHTRSTHFPDLALTPGLGRNEDASVVTADTIAAWSQRGGRDLPLPKPVGNLLSACSSPLSGSNLPLQGMVGHPY